MEDSIPDMVVNSDGSVAKTQAVFDAEWANYGWEGSITERFSVEEENNLKSKFLNEVELDEGFFNGKIVLDAGCGEGLYPVFLSKLGCEVIAVDIGKVSVMRTKGRKDNPSVTVVQANPLMPPFREESFDYVYSIGVIHHTPNPRESFARLSGLLKRGGRMYIRVYKNLSFKVEVLSKLARWITTRLPYQTMYKLSGIISSILCKFLPQTVKKYHWLGRPWFIFDWLTPPVYSHHMREEVLDWFRDLGYESVKVDVCRISGLKGLGVKV
ncbi:MAG: class I SAM-dependent methyltransferase [bacterium]